MLTTTCPEFDADLDALPSAEPCPTCGKRHRTCGLPPAIARAEAGDIGIVVETAVAELTSMPADQARAILEQARKIIELGGTISGRTILCGTLTVERTVTANASE